MAEVLRDLVELAVVVDPTYDQNCYVVHRRDTDAAIVIDPGLQSARALQLLEENSWRCERILLTHGHGDHVNGVPAMKKAHRCPVALHPLDGEQLVSMRFLPGIPEDVPDVVVDEDLRDGQVISWHGIDLGVLHTPGHTRGSVCFRLDLDGEQPLLFSGDHLFAGSIGRTDLPFCNPADLAQSLDRISRLPPETVVYPGHGMSTTIKEERESNPFLNGTARIIQS